MPTFTLPPRLVESALRPVYRTILNDRMPVAGQRRLLDFASVVQPVVRGVRRDSVVLGGRPAERFVAVPPAAARATAGRSAAARPPRTVLYLHGGGFVTGSPRTHRPLTARLARDTGAEVYSLDYRLAPENPYPAAVDDAEAAFTDLARRHGDHAASIAVAGDSAGGGIAAALTRRLLDHGHRPAALVLIAPAVDPGADAGTMTEDAVLRRGWIRFACAAYRGATPADDPGFAPLHADTRGFPPTYVQVGSREMLHEHAARYVRLLRDDGVDVTFDVSPTLWHVAQLQSGLVREAAESVDAIAAFLRERLPR
ncbi:alpha/beta hydrolase [Tomitella fengzijianii]|uniref:Alpha/beta hydrolase n=1 Tax=Tomitella fengzijianii TaxID=2597660 RepID=A0A516X2I8_9ACTN|nr:alpha/beta hydrolase [Tomitella fengzijianii]QDQ97250.1 alpha/beta hydrolase [Tomitella fengzijianii]